MQTDFARRLEKSRRAREDTFIKSGKGTRAGVAHRCAVRLALKVGCETDSI